MALSESNSQGLPTEAIDVIVPGVDGVNDPLPSYESFMDVLELPTALRGGTRAMREKRTKFLPQEDGETDRSYENRLARSFLLNAYSRTVQKFSGEVFQKEIFIDDIPDDIKDYFEDIDGEGTDLESFLRKLFERNLNDSVIHLLVDYPSVRMMKDEASGVTLYYDVNEENPERRYKPLTREVEIENGWKPYWVKVNPDQVIGWRTEKVNGKNVLSQVRIREVTEEAYGDWGTQKRERVRVLRPGSWELWEQKAGDIKNNQGNMFYWALVDEGTTTLNYIPFFTCLLGEKITEMTCELVLDGLAYLNLAHWQSNSDQRNVLHYARLITYFGKMLDTESGGDLKVGANVLINSNSPDSDLKVVEHTGKGIESGRQDLMDIERQMSLFGLSAMMPTVTGGVTATEKVIDKVENNSALYGWVIDFEDFIQQALRATGDYIGYKDVGEIKLNKEFSNPLTEASVKMLIDAFTAGLLPREVVVEELKRRGFIRNDWELPELIMMIENDMRSNMAGSTFENSPMNEVEEEMDDEEEN